MLEIALTGNRYSGKTKVSKVFNGIYIPVFDADTVMKFILNYRPDFDDAIKAIKVEEANQVKTNAANKAALLDRLGITADEAKLLLS